jgi:hypothetical protein
MHLSQNDMDRGPGTVEGLDLTNTPMDCMVLGRLPKAVLGQWAAEEELWDAVEQSV